VSWRSLDPGGQGCGLKTGQAEMSIMTRILDRVRREIALAIRTRTVRMRNMGPIVSLFIR
jgi:hypothetical protein